VFVLALAVNVKILIVAKIINAAKLKKERLFV